MFHVLSQYFMYIYLGDYVFIYRYSVFIRVCILMNIIIHKNVSSIIYIDLFECCDSP